MLKSRLLARRQIIQGLATWIIAQSAPRAFAASARVPDEGLLEVSLFAWQDAVAAEASIDFWTAQLGMVETVHLPASARVIVKWSDVCLRRSLHLHLPKASRAIEDYYGVCLRKDSSNSEAYLHGQSELAATLASVFSKASIGSVAVVDVASCGLSSLDWADIMPLLQRSYRLVVCVDYAIPELTSLEAEFRDLGCSTDAPTGGLIACDRFEVTTDETLSLDPIVSYEQRAMLYTDYVSELINELANDEAQRGIQSFS